MPIKDPVIRAINHKKYMKEVWYPANKAKHQMMVHRRKGAIQLFLRNIKRLSGCIRCPEKDWRCLDFHHKYRKKEAALSRMPQLGWSWKRILAEVRKCIVICSNCHRKEHIKLI
jgi:hypothetical protein